MKKRIKKIAAVLAPTKTSAHDNKHYKSWLELLINHPDGIGKDAAFRINMTTSCRDSDYIPKVKDAGGIRKISGLDYQIMHNGLLVEHGGYFGDWMSETITTLKGHHEPQEEKVFYELLKLLPKKATMIELGSYWGYYSLWFNKYIEDGVNYCCEPDPKNLALGKRNAKINDAKNITFINSAAGELDGKVISFKPQEGDFDPVEVPIRSIDSIVEEYDIPRLDILHMDIQGVELSAIKGAYKSIEEGKVRFLIVSTHHYLISNEPLTHEKCIKKIEELGGHIIVEHAVHESFSGDGLVVASFFEEDKDFHIDVSENRMQDSLFRSYNVDLSILIAAYEELREKANGA